MLFVCLHIYVAVVWAQPPGPFLYDEPRQGCAGWCYKVLHNEPQEWTTKCGWNLCADCSDCDAVDLSTSCPKWCEDKGDWSTACGFDECKTCDSCQGVELCAGWCNSKANIDWEKKCLWTNCAGCSQCDTEACADGDSIYARFNGDNVYGGSITSTDSAVFDITFADGSSNAGLPPSHVFSTTNNGCPGTWRTNVCSVGSTIWAQYEPEDWYKATIVSMTITEVNVDWGDGSDSQVSIGETELCDCNDENCVPCVDHCSCDAADTIPDNTMCPK